MIDSATPTRRAARERPTRARPESMQVDGRQFVWRQDLADRAIRFCETFCRHFRGELAGETLVLEPWQRWIVEELFGWQRAAGTRRYREAFVFVARKNGKTFLLASIALYLLVADGEPGAEIYAAAADKDQARLLYDAAVKIVEQEPRLARRLTVYRNAILYPATSSAFRVLSAEAYTKHGLNGHGVLLDELHAHQDRELYDVLTTSVGARRQPLVVSITTAGLWDESHVCWQRYQYAKRVAADPAVDPHFLPVLYETSPEDDWHSPEVWRRANPGLAGGKLVREDYLAEEHRKACADPSLENRFRRLHLNQWTQQVTRWIPVDKWRACRRKAPPVSLEGRPCVLGVDLSLSDDLSAVVALHSYPAMVDAEPDDTGWGVWVEPYFWVPGDELDARSRRDHAEYGLWAKRGLVEVIDGPVIDDVWIERRIRELCAARQVLAICFDPFAAAGLAARLEAERWPVVFIKQSAASIAPAAKTFHRLVLSRRLAHPGHAVLDYCAANVGVRRDAHDNVYPVKTRSRGRIDGISAILTGLSRLMADPLPRRCKTSGEIVTLL